MIGALALALDAVAPLRLAAPWDNVGLLLGDPADPLRRALLTIDLTDEVLEEAVAAKCEAIVAYHPPIFDAVTRLTAIDPRQRLLLRCAQRRIALLSPHTALDAVRGGLTDWLAQRIDGGERTALEPAALAPRVLVTVHAPAASVDALRHAMAAAGAGTIGGYSHCSFAVAGLGTFLGGAASTPAVGRRGRLEEVDEVKLSMIADASRRAAVLGAIRRTHPYETPAVHATPLAAEVDPHQGQGRAIAMRQPRTAVDIARRLRSALRLPAGMVQVCAGKRPRRHARVAVVAGSGAAMLPQALAADCTLLVTGEAKHHDVLRAREHGCDLILAGHTNTERGFLPHLAKLLKPHLPGVRLLVSRRDRAPLTAG
jgi:dinuclear metal center YbgI/SA1388 family protein